MMTLRYPTEWLAKAEDALRRLAERPWALLVVLLSVNALAHPYAGITHDTRLYSVQVLNRVEDGAYSDDLFFRFGSQDDYSLFSHVAAPLVRWLGLPAAFFLIYLLSKSLLFWGMIRIVQTLVPNRVAGVLALIYCMAIGMHYGGQQLLNVQENFVTPRTPACALVLIGLDLLLRGRPAWSLALILLAAGIHPLMAFGGMLIWIGFHLWTYLGVKTLVAALAGACLLAVIVVGIEPIGTRCFGAMDDEWRQNIMHASSFNFPSQWARGDWCFLAFQLAILGIVIWKVRSLDSRKARFLIVLGMVTLAGAVGAILAEQLPYALLLQGQPYRALWMLSFLHLAFVFQLCIEWSREGEAPAQPKAAQDKAPPQTLGSAGASPSQGAPTLVWQLAGCGLLAYLCCVNAIVDEYILVALLFPLVAVALRGLHRQPEHPAWLVQSVRLSLVLGAFAWAGYKVLLLARGVDELFLFHFEYRDIFEVLLHNLGPIVLGAGLCWLVVRMGPKAHGRLSAGFALAGCLALQALFFAFPETDFYLEHCTRYRADLRQIHEIMHRQRERNQPLPTVYCNLGCLDYVWLDLHSKSYFDWWQAGNFMFRREMAVEGRRRARLVAPFEIARYRKIEHQMTQGQKDSIARFFQTDFQRGPVCKDDLARLCQEPGLDYLVLDEQVDGVNAVPVGRLYLYSCQEVRVALDLPGPSSSTRIAVREP